VEEQTVQRLLSLQEFDASIKKLREERRRLHAELLELDVLDERWTAGEAKQQKKVDESATEIRRAERVVQAGRATLKRLQERAQHLQRSRDVAAARTEVDAARQNLDDAETTMLEEMQAHDRARIGLEDLDRTNQEERQVAAERRAEIEARTAELDTELGRLEGERGETAGSIDAGIRTEYDRVSGGRTTQALAPVVEGCCGHCYTAIPMQRQAEIRAGAKLIVCEGCGVILHAGAEK
jgi:hypothetical protein